MAKIQVELNKGELKMLTQVLQDEFDDINYDIELHLARITPNTDTIYLARRKLKSQSMGRLLEKLQRLTS